MQTSPADNHKASRVRHVIVAGTLMLIAQLLLVEMAIRVVHTDAWYADVICEVMGHCREWLWSRLGVSSGTGTDGSKIDE